PAAGGDEADRTGGDVNFDGKKVLVTGGARGIGRATARAFAERGAKVAIGYRTGLAEAERTLASLPGDGHVAIAGDLTDPDVARHVVEGAIEALGGLDVLVNSAGVGGHHRLDAVSYDEWRAAFARIVDTNLIAPANTCYVAARHMMTHGGGRIVNVSS